jgi:regulator of sigma E protease
MQLLQTVVSFILVLSLLVFVHELGHFLFAKRAGILVREFAIGFGPKVFSRKRGETEYSIRLLPLGGFVRMAGEDPETLEVKTGSKVFAKKNEQGQIAEIYLYEPQELQGDWIVGRVVEMETEHKLYMVLADEEGRETRYPLHPQTMIYYNPKTEMQIAPWDRQFGSKTVGQKAMTIFAGPLFNIILTVLFFTIYTLMVGVEVKTPIKEVLPDTPAAKAGLKPGDVIEAIDGKEITTFDMLRVTLIESRGKELNFTIRRGNEKLEIPITPVKQGDAYVIGVVPESKRFRDATILEAIQGGFARTWEWSGIILDSFRQLVTGELSVKNLGGPLQMGDITGKAAQEGIIPLIKWTALLSLNLAIFNLLPIPALDGSRLVFIGIEAVRGRPIHPNKESLVHFVGFALLMVLMLLVTYNDIVKIFFT